MNQQLEIKHTGATFTPKRLADFLSNKLLSYLKKDNNIKVLDPACGDGELLLSVGEKLSCAKINYSLTGFDSNNNYLVTAQERIKNILNTEANLCNEDFLNAINVTVPQRTLDFSSKLYENKINSQVDLVIANPPYVRTQILGAEQAQALANKFNLKGRVDLYYPFLIAMTESLKKDGILGVITSNRYLSTKSGGSVRKFLSNNYDILEVIDLGDTKLFDAAVLPAIFIARKRKGFRNSNAAFIKLYEDQNGFNGNAEKTESIYTILTSDKTGYFRVGTKTYKKTEGFLKYEVGSEEVWSLLSKEEAAWISKINESATSRTGDHFKVRVGIKTTADKVFISDKWDELGEDKPEKELLKPLLSQENIDAWSATSNEKLKVLYTHYVQGKTKKTIDIGKFPKTKKYFNKNKKRLSGRKYVIEAGRKWYEIWVPQKPDLWQYPKLIFPDISVKPRFYFDREGKIVNGNCYWIVAKELKDIEKLLLIQGIANSKLMTKYHDLSFNNKLYSGRRRYFTQYVERYPLPDLNSEYSKKIIELVKKLNAISNSSETNELECLLESKVAGAFGVEPIKNLD